MAREHAGLSQGQVAKLLRMHRPTISEIEAGRRKVSVDELAKFAQTYDVGVGWLSGEDSHMTGALGGRIELAARELAKLKKDDVELVLKLLRTLRGMEGKAK
jgi:transcriptional regulator with XRE-family HTH domain